MSQPLHVCIIASIRFVIDSLCREDPDATSVEVILLLSAVDQARAIMRFTSYDHNHDFSCKMHRSTDGGVQNRQDSLQQIRPSHRERTMRKLTQPVRACTVVENSQSNYRPSC